MSIAMPSVGWIGPWIALAFTIGLPRLVGEQVDGVRGVVPQQVVGPAARLAERVHVRAAEEVGLHVHLLDVEFAAPDPLAHPLVARVEAARVAAHRDLAGLPARPSTTACPSSRQSQSGISTCTCLPACRQAIACAACIGVGVHRMTASTSFIARLSARSVVTCGMPYLPRDLLRSCRARGSTSETTFDAVDRLDRVEVLDAERAGAGERDVDAHVRFSAHLPSSLPG